MHRPLIIEVNAKKLEKATGEPQQSTDCAKLLGEKHQGRVQEEKAKAEAEEEEETTSADKNNRKEKRTCIDEHEI